MFGERVERTTLGSIDFQKLVVSQSELQELLALAPSYVWLALATEAHKQKPDLVAQKKPKSESRVVLEVVRGLEYPKLVVKLQNTKKQYVTGPPSLLNKRYFIRATMITPTESALIREVANQLWWWNPEMGDDEVYHGGQQVDLKNLFFPIWNMKFVESGLLRVEVLDITNNIGRCHNPT